MGPQDHEPGDLHHPDQLRAPRRGPVDDAEPPLRHHGPRAPEAAAGLRRRRARARPAEDRGDRSGRDVDPPAAPSVVDGDASKQGDDLEAIPRWLTRGAPALLLLLGVTVYSLVALLDISREGEGEGPVAAPSRDAETSGGGAAAAPGEASAPSKAPSLLARGTPAQSLLGLSLERLRGDGGAAFVDLDDVIKGGEVTVINLWGAWCEPCKRELPDLKRMFDRASWGTRSPSSRSTRRPKIRGRPTPSSPR
ncbi:MAG: redoxin domain-containing protein [Myxococcales bacterium]|nr:redoxin domain-containing protein [Myxococcales bacterium]